jgi:nitrate reductase assembly molybdenum cofactor insertion protein NarJ
VNDSTPASEQLAIVVRDLARVIDRLTDAATAARGLSAATDWQSKAATAFHEKAEAWAVAVSALSSLAEDARADAAHARDRAAFREAEAYAALLAPAGAR